MRQPLLALLLLASWPALAQQLPTPPALRPPAAPDTAAALHRLFAYKRHQRPATLAVTLAGGGLFFLAGTQASSLNAGALLAAVGVLALPASAAELLLYRQYSHRREEQALASLQAHRLPARLRRKLTNDYFQEPTPRLP